MATAGDQINAALRLLGVLASGEQPEANELSDAILALNQMLDSWSIERLSVFCTIDNTVTWPAGQATQTIGPSGDFSITPCPVQIDDATYYNVGNISYPIQMVNQDQYNSITLKGSTSTLPQIMFANRAANQPNEAISMTIWPVPTQAIEMHLISVSPLANVSAASDDLIFPPGYLRAFKYNLAVELAPEFGVEPSRTVKAIARDSKRNLKRLNNPGDVMGMPFPLLGGVRYNIFAGNY